MVEYVKVDQPILIVGITPLILKRSIGTEFHFYVEFESVALPGDG